MARSNKKDKNKKNKIDFSMHTDLLERFIGYTLSESALVTNRSLNNMKKFIDSISFSSDNYEAKKMFDILQVILENQVDENIKDFSILKESVSNNPLLYDDREYVREMMDYCSKLNICEDDISYLDRYIEEKMTYNYLYMSQELLNKGFNNLNSGFSAKEVNKELEPIINQLYRSMQDVKAVQKEALEDFSIGRKSFKASFMDAVRDAKRPNNKIKTGLQGLNEMINGGYENGRVYTYLALPKCGKSMVLLNSCIWAAKYCNFKPKDPTKTPTILYVTMENNKRESIERIYSYVTGDSLRDIPNDKVDEALELVEKEIQGDRNVNLEIRYRSYKSIDTDDLNRMIDELASNNQEVVMVVLDYLKRIRSVQNSSEPRIELGDVVNELADIAKSRDIPIVTASQLNREAYKIIEAEQERMRNANTNAMRTNLTKLLNKSHVGESALIIENTDYAIIINPEVDPLTNEEYTVFKLVASRSKKNKLTYFAQKMVNGMRMMEDISESKPCYLESIGESSMKSFNPNDARQTISDKEAQKNSSRLVNNFNRNITGTDGEIDI